MRVESFEGFDAPHGQFGAILVLKGSNVRSTREVTSKDEPWPCHSSIPYGTEHSWNGVSLVFG